jgi:hypothetical protein
MGWINASRQGVPASRGAVAATRRAPRTGRRRSRRRSGAEAAPETRLLDPVDDCRGERPERGGIEQQDGLAQVERLPGDDGQERHVRGVADVAIGPADDQARRRRHRRRRPETLDNEPRECLRKQELSRHKQNPAKSAQGRRARSGFDTGRRWRRLANNLGTIPATTPGPARKNTALPTAAIRRRTDWHRPSMPHDTQYQSANCTVSSTSSVVETTNHGMRSRRGGSNLARTMKRGKRTSTKRGMLIRA